MKDGSAKGVKMLDQLGGFLASSTVIQELVSVDIEGTYAAISTKAAVALGCSLALFVGFGVVRYAFGEVWSAVKGGRLRG